MDYIDDASHYSRDSSDAENGAPISWLSVVRNAAT